MGLTDTPAAISSPFGSVVSCLATRPMSGDGVGSCDCSADSDVVKHVGLDHLRCSARFSRHLNTTRMTHGHAYGRPTSKKQRHKMAADEAGSAKYRDAAGHDLSLLDVIVAF